MSESVVTLQWVDVGTLDDLWEGEYADIEIEDDFILLIHCPDGVIRAYQGYCPHQEQALADGECDGGVLTCSAHLWQFDIYTGEGINPDGCQLYQYEVRVEDEIIYVGIPQDGGRHYNRCTAAE